MPWIINAVGAGFIGFGLGGCGDIALTYVQDSYDGVGLTRTMFYNILANENTTDNRPRLDRSGVCTQWDGYSHDVRDPSLD